MSNTITKKDIEEQRQRCAGLSSEFGGGVKSLVQGAKMKNEKFVTAQQTSTTGPSNS